MNIGTICYATQSGLGHLGKMFIDNGIVNRILEIPHPRYKSFGDVWYDSNTRFNHRQLAQFLDGLDVILIFENAFNYWGLIDNAQRYGIKFVLVPMYEWTPSPLPSKPDFVICPSLLDVEYFKEYNHKFIPIPAPNERDIPWRERQSAIHYVHNAGHGQVGYAKGTPEVLEAFARYVRSDAKLLVRGQRNEPRIKEVFDKYSDSPRITFVYDDIPYNELFNTGDVYINAERYNGLSLPLQEAYSAGMCVMTTNRFPANSWLPEEPLIPVASYEQHRVSQSEIERAKIDPRTIASYVDAWYGRDIRYLSHLGREWRNKNSWDKLKPIYLNLFTEILK